jgi:hypothetical protein
MDVARVCHSSFVCPDAHPLKLQGQPPRPAVNRRHTAQFKPRSSPLAGPALSSEGGHGGVGDDRADLKPRYKPSRISSTPELQSLDRIASEWSDVASTSTHDSHYTNFSLLSSSHGSDATTVSSHSTPSLRSDKRRSRVSLSGSSTKGVETAVPPVPAWARASSVSLPPSHGRTSSAPSTSRNPEENWLTAKTTPRFSRHGMNAPGVVMPVSARAHPSRNQPKRPKTAPGNSDQAAPRFNGETISRSAPPTIGYSGTRAHGSRPPHWRAQTCSQASMSAALSARSRSASTPTIITPISESVEEASDVDSPVEALAPPPPIRPASRTSTNSLPVALPSMQSVPSLTRSESGDEGAVTASDVSTSTMGSIGTLAPDPSLAFYMRSASTTFMSTTVSASSLPADHSDVETVGKRRKFSKLTSPFRRKKTKARQESSPPFPPPAIVVQDETGYASVDQLGRIQTPIQGMSSEIRYPAVESTPKKSTGLWRRFTMSVTGRRASRGQPVPLS